MKFDIVPCHDLVVHKQLISISKNPSL